MHIDMGTAAQLENEGYDISNLKVAIPAQPIGRGTLKESYVREWHIRDPVGEIKNKAQLPFKRLFRQQNCDPLVNGAQLSLGGRDN